MAGVKDVQGQYVFGLDIGTRSIVGTVGYMNNDKFHVIAQKIKEHETRAMLDGQIHDIAQVGATIKQVKEALEEETGRKLSEVCIAAAGRVLKTVTTRVDYVFDTDKEVNEDDINNLTTMGIEKAYEEFQETNNTDIKFYCVGYTPIRYYLNGYQIGNLDGHKAHSIGIDLIATFLPDDVVDGLYKAVGIAGLNVANLTLEPIAAISVAIPEKFRLLNLALVDVGAGTSDISITKEGTITAYGMIPVAGDSLTDVIVQHCLVEFDTAERIKRESTFKDVIEYTDIIGLPQSITREGVQDILRGAIDNMTKLAADAIRDLNGDKSVSAVFVVGGGGIIPGYTESLANELGIAKERVAIRGREVMQNIVFEMENARKDSLMVTPIGICLSYYEQSNNFIFVDFNGEKVKLYDNGKLTIADVAVSAQYANEDLFPKRGKAITFTVNGKTHTIRGRQGEAAEITINGNPAAIYALIHAGDRIEVKSSTVGEDASQAIGKLAELSDTLHVIVNGTRVELPKTATVNGRMENEYYQIQDGDVIEVRNSYTVEELAEFLDVPCGDSISVNGTAAKASTSVYENFEVTWTFEDKKSQDNLEDVEPEFDEADNYEQDDIDDEYSAASDTEGDTEEAAYAGDSSYIPENEYEQPAPAVPVIEQPKKQLNMLVTVLVNGQSVTMTHKPSYVFVDVFDYISFDLSASGGRSIVTLLNGRKAEYMENLKNGDVIQIYWE